MSSHLLLGRKGNGINHSAGEQNISSHNQGSINFHLKNGFTECGHLREIGKKNDMLFDIIYMQKMI